MIELIMIAGSVLTPVQESQLINQFCSDVVGIPYASDNFTDEQWERFEYCRDSVRLPK